MTVPKDISITVPKFLWYLSSKKYLKWFEMVCGPDVEWLAVNNSVGDNLGLAGNKHGLIVDNE